MLEINHVNAFYGNVQVLWDVSLEVKEAEIVALIGANGAGKTTLLNAIAGLQPPQSGEILFLGKRLNGLPSRIITEMGISYLPEGGRLFPEMTVVENLEMGAYVLSAWKRRKERLSQVYQWFPRLKERERQLARTLSGGERQMLAMGRGLMAGPRLFLLDELSYGLAPKVVSEAFQVIKGMRDQGITILLVEQNVKQTLEIADRAYVLENGRIVLAGGRSELRENDYVKKAYLGM
ncbi:MAG: ABC transporter ATP-binding protein [Ignavibacteriales bacterium]